MEKSWPKKATFNILFVGDVFGKLGRQILFQQLPILKKQHEIDLTIVNGENATHGCALSQTHFRQFKAAGIDVVTGGNHTFHLPEVYSFIGKTKTLLRPYNYVDVYPGKGTILIKRAGLKIRITNLLGTTFINGKLNDPFLSFQTLLKKGVSSDCHLVDFHGEASAEKAAFAWAFDGKITAVLGTHTHVQTNDARLLPQKTFFITDVGMTGPYHSIIGARPDYIIAAELGGKKKLIRPVTTGPKQLNAVVLKIDRQTHQIVEYETITQLFPASS